MRIELERNRHLESMKIQFDFECLRVVLPKIYPASTTMEQIARVKLTARITES